jgi:Tfp pilus assembly protein PilO
VKAKLVLIGVGAAVVLTGLWFFLLWKPAGASLDTARAEKVAAVQKASELQTRLAHLKLLEKNADTLEQRKALLATAIPDADQLDQFILQVNERATKAGVSFVSVSPSQPATGGAAPAAAAAAAPTNIALQIQVSGDYFQVLKFLEELRDGPRLLTVDTFTLSKGDAGKMTGAIGARMFMGTPGTAAATTAPVAPANSLQGS